MNAIELWLLEKLLSEAETPEAKAWVLAQLKGAEAATSNPLLKMVLETVEKFLSAPAG